MIATGDLSQRYMTRFCINALDGDCSDDPRIVGSDRPNMLRKIRNHSTIEGQPTFLLAPALSTANHKMSYMSIHEKYADRPGIWFNPEKIMDIRRTLGRNRNPKHFLPRGRENLFKSVLVHSLHCTFKQVARTVGLELC
jgi:hypothetical protein